MAKRVDKVIDKVCLFNVSCGSILLNIKKQIQELHRKYLEEGIGKRDIMIVAHGHFSRVLIARWVQFPICLGTHFNVEPAGVSSSHCNSC